ncbi:hypothetical protein [Candidatus Kuenenia stuttgartiensis]|uniref:hypothetical protein n=1 Tax=Kuenenia stuttgartiensis TaxID=174633 RepID=UPI00146DB829|nr:hypothetical protein [Candidatus Kuenenia stuttgartiensis]
MLKKVGLMRGICLLGMFGMFAVGTGCGELKQLRVENQQLSQSLAVCSRKTRTFRRRQAGTKANSTGLKIRDGILSQSWQAQEQSQK